MGAFTPSSGISRVTTIFLLHASFAVLLIFGIMLAFGIVGELVWESHKDNAWSPWDRKRRFSPKSAYKLASMAVLIGVLGELVGDAGVFFFSEHLQTIDEKDSAGIQDNGPRILSEKQQNLLIGAWSKYAGKIVQLSRVDDPEAINLADVMVTILTKAHLKVFQVAFSSGEFVFGVMVLGPMNEPAVYDFSRTLDCAAIFSTPFPRCGVTGMPATSSLARPTCDLKIDIGFNPMGKRWKDMAEMECKDLHLSE